MPKHHTPGLPARDWEPFFVAAKVLIEKLNDAKSSHSKTVIMGQFLSPLVGSEVPIQVDGRVGKAKLCVIEGRSKEKRYFFEVSWGCKLADDASRKRQYATDEQKHHAANGGNARRTGDKKPSEQRAAKKKKAAGPAKQATQTASRTKRGKVGNEEKW